MSEAKKEVEPISTLPKEKLKDEMNLAEWSGVIFGCTDNSQKLRVFEEESTDFKTASRSKNRLEVACSSGSSLPYPSDQKLFLVLLSKAAENLGAGPRVSFSQWELLKKLGWAPDGRNYARLKNALDRLSSTQLTFQNLWYNNGEKKRSNSRFTLIAELHWSEAQKGGRRVKEEDKGYFVLPSPLWKSLEDRFVKDIKLEYVQKLSDLSLTLYRLFDKRFWSTNHLEFEIIELAKKVGIEKTKSNTLKRIRQKLQRAGDELIEIGYLRRFELKRIARGQYQVIAELKEGRALTAQDSSLEARLIAHGVTAARARKLVAEGSTERIEAILSYFENEVLVRNKKEIRNPGAWLATAIKNPDFKLPESNVVVMPDKKKEKEPQFEQVIEEDEQGRVVVRRVRKHQY